MSAASGYIAVDGLDVHETEDGLILFNPATDRVHHLNHTAGAIFVLCDGSRDEGGLVAAIRETFSLPDPPTELVRTTISELVEEGVLVPVPGT